MIQFRSWCNNDAKITDLGVQELSQNIGKLNQLKQLSLNLQELVIYSASC